MVKKGKMETVPQRDPCTSGVTALQYVDEHKKEQARSLRKASTPAEKVLWDQLRNRQVAGFKFRRQQVVDGFIADFYCESVKMAIEVDGNVHDNKEQQLIDEHREKVFWARGIHTLRFKNDDILHNINWCIEVILFTARKRALSG
jgi:very-short-patch-repair endonuclease